MHGIKVNLDQLHWFTTFNCTGLFCQSKGIWSRSILLHVHGSHAFIYRPEHQMWLLWFNVNGNLAITLPFGSGHSIICILEQQLGACPEYLVLGASTLVSRDSQHTFTSRFPDRLCRSHTLMHALYSYCIHSSSIFNLQRCYPYYLAAATLVFGADVKSQAKVHEVKVANQTRKPIKR